jgi:hypothetical protein
LLASGLRWPDAPLATWRGGRAFCAGRGGVGIVLTLAGLALWSQVVPGVCALVIAWTAVQQRNTWGLAGTLALLGSFVVAATGKADSNYLGLFNTVQLMHYTLALALALLAVGLRAHHKTSSSRLPERSGGARLAQGFPFGDLGCGQQALHHITGHDDTGAGQAFAGDTSSPSATSWASPCWRTRRCMRRMWQPKSSPVNCRATRNWPAPPSTPA